MLYSIKMQYIDKYKFVFHNVLCTIEYNTFLHMSRIQFDCVYRSYFFISAVVPVCGAVHTCV